MNRDRDRGELAIVLHTHMPYVVGHGTWPFGEEWLWRAVAESYLRLEPVIERAPLTIGLTPVICDQFEAMRGSAGDRFGEFVTGSREYCFGEDMAAFHEVGRGELGAALAPQLEEYRAAVARFDEIGRDLLGIFVRAQAGGAELMSGPATHPILPLLATDFGVALQLRAGVDGHRARFGAWGGGVWLPECAYRPGLAQRLAREGVSHFCVDQTPVYGVGAPQHLRPLLTSSGAIAAPIDWQTVALVWDERGYPSAPVYRSTFRRTIHALMPYANDGSPYDPDRARAQARDHARHFVASVRGRLDAFHAETGTPGLCTFAVDTELLGHWWYEGAWWLADVLELASEAGLPVGTLADAIERVEPVECEPAASTWGEHKDFSTWDSPDVAAMTWRQRACELQLYDALGPDGRGAGSHAALTATRELLALQSSDWAFMHHRETAADYPDRRFKGHAAAFRYAIESMSQSTNPTGGHGPTAREQHAEPGISPALDNETLAEIRCAY